MNKRFLHGNTIRQWLIALLVALSLAIPAFTYLHRQDASANLPEPMELAGPKEGMGG